MYYARKRMQHVNRCFQLVTQNVTVAVKLVVLNLYRRLAEMPLNFWNSSEWDIISDEYQVLKDNLSSTHSYLGKDKFNSKYKDSTITLRSRSLKNKIKLVVTIWMQCWMCYWLWQQFSVVKRCFPFSWDLFLNKSNRNHVM